MATATKAKRIKLTAEQRRFLRSCTNGRYEAPDLGWQRGVAELVRRGVLVYDGIWRSVHHWRLTEAGRAALKRSHPERTLKGSKQAVGEPDVAKKRGAVKNPETPLGQTAAFMRHRMERLGLSYKDLAVRLQKAGWDGSHHAVRKWLTGANGPTLGDLRYVAEALGYADWVGFVAAVGRYRDES